MKVAKVLVSTVLYAPFVASVVFAAPAADVEEQPLAFSSLDLPATQRLSLSLVSYVTSFLSQTLGFVTKDSPFASADTEEKSIWQIINHSEEFSQFAHVLNYSSDSTKDLLKKDGVTFFAPLNWRGHKDQDQDQVHNVNIMDPDSNSFAAAAEQQWRNLENTISEFEQTYASSALSELDKDCDDEKKRRRKLIRHIVDALVLYHTVDSDGPLDAKTIAANSSVATRLATPEHKFNDGTSFRIRTGKSLLPLPAIYLNFYSRLVKPDIKAKNGLIHGIKYLLIIPPDVLQGLFFGQTTFSTSTSALQKVDASKYLAYPYRHHGWHHGDKHNDSVEGTGICNTLDMFKSGHGDKKHFAGVPAETLFVPTNLAWARLPFIFRAYLFSPWGYHFLQKIFMLHSLPSDIVYADFVHHVSSSSHASYEPKVSFDSHGSRTSYTFDTVLPALHGDKGKFETVDVDVYRYYLFPGQKGPLQTRVAVQNVSVIVQDIPARNGVYHAIDQFIKPKGHPEKGIWAEIAAATELAGYGSVDLHAEALSDMW